MGQDMILMFLVKTSEIGKSMTVRKATAQFANEWRNGWANVADSHLLWLPRVCAEEQINPRDRRKEVSGLNKQC